MAENVVEFKNITKTFGGTVALDRVSFATRKGEITGLVGENGAGKTTLIKIIGGIFTPEEGEIFYEGEEISIKSPQHAEELGISIVHQDLPICENLTVAQNIFLGSRIPGNFGFPDRTFMKEQTVELFERLNIELDPDKPVTECSMGQRQMVIIAKALAGESNFILMDEPTTALSPDEVSVLYDVIERLKEEGISVVFVSHRLNEVIKVSDRIFVLKDGEFVGSVSQKEATEDKLTRMMVGRDVKVIQKKDSNSIQEETALKVENITQHELGLKDISFELKKGEILGMAGLQGAGRTELARCIIGNHQIDSGEIYLEGENIEINSPQFAIKNGIGYLPEDRDELGLFEKLDIRTNISIASLDKLSKRGLVQNKKVIELTKKYQKELDIKMRSLEQNIGSLSGGNQQKVLLARWLAVQPKILIMDEPTRGIDVGTKTEIRRLTMDLVKEGYSIILISSEMVEVMSISDRIIVMSNGHITGEFNHREVTEEKIMKAAVEEMVV
ncbi:MAG: sugar ABC transporter ATP-binding protein [Bacillota bacterium]